jgi:hypothetical protein
MRTRSSFAAAHRSALAALATAALGAATVLVGGAASASPAAATLVVDDNLACPGATFSTISSAVAAANPGDTIKVCAGIYPETVNVDKSLTFLGAKAGFDGRKKRKKLNKESVVVSLQGDFVMQPGVDDVTIDGFTLQGAGSDAFTADAIEAFAGGSGFTIVNNVIRDNELGINLQNPDPSHPTEIARNAFINNSLGTTAEGGTAIFISNGPANNTTIENNSFSLDRETAINFAGDPNNPSRGLVVADNSSKNDSTFVVATNSVDALIDGNSISYSGSTNGSGILDFGSNTALRISSNTISGGNGSGTSGIRIAAFTGVPSVATTVVDNAVSGRYNGIRVTDGYDDLYLASNTVTGSTNVGILVETGNTGNVFLRNVVRTSAVHDCEDDTTGSSSAGTANVWRHDSGNSGNSSPIGTCPA